MRSITAAPGPYECVAGRCRLLGLLYSTAVLLAHAPGLKTSSSRSNLDEVSALGQGISHLRCLSAAVRARRLLSVGVVTQLDTQPGRRPTALAPTVNSTRWVRTSKRRRLLFGKRSTTTVGLDGVPVQELPRPAPGRSRGGPQERCI